METKVAGRAWKVIASEREVGVDTSVSLHPIIRQLLVNRGVGTEAEAVERFFNPNYERDIHDPFLFRNMRKAVGRIFLALQSGEHITVHGDYDADGVTGSTVIIATLREIAILLGKPDAPIDFYIPHREDEGYGMHNETVEILHERGTKLIITVDCGISCAPQIALAVTHGIDTIVLDHHEFFPESLPDAILIHPRLPGETYPFPFLAAVGVSWKVACALLASARERNLAVPLGAEKWLLDLVAIATVTDVVPLVGENRTLEHFGLRVLRKTRRLGFQKLFAVAGTKIDAIDTHVVGFQIGPRINAAGRMEHASVALELLLSTDDAEADVLALRLQEHNVARQEESKRILAEARTQVMLRPDAPILLAYGEDWSPALVGIAAGRLAQEFGRPALFLGRIGDRWIGSGRSIPGFHITDAIREVADCLERFGGHPQACGFTTFADERFTQFLVRIEAVAEKRLAGIALSPVLSIDAELTSADITSLLIDALVKFEPYGEGNTEPRFMSRNLIVVQSDLLGNTGRHLKLLLRFPDGTTRKFIGFGFGSRMDECVPGARIDAVYELGWNDWNGRREVQCKLVDLRSAYGA